MGKFQGRKINVMNTVKDVTNQIIKRSLAEIQSFMARSELQI